MVMYTERQLDKAYATFVTQLHRIKLEQNIDIFVPDREDFRRIFESVWEDIYSDEWWLDDSTRH
jgi:hypothetical protein